MPVPRIPLVNGMARATAAIYDLPFVEVAGEEFPELD